MAILSIVIVQALVSCPVATAISQKRWSKFDLEEIDHQWNGIYEDEDDISQDERLYNQSERHRNDAMEKLQNFIDKGTHNPSELQKLTNEAEHAGKAAMIFAKLSMKYSSEMRTVNSGNKDEKVVRDEEANINVWSWDALAEICYKWQYELNFELITITCYPMEPDTVLVTVQRGWEGKDVYDYLSIQDEIEELKWNDKKTWPSQRDKSDD